MLQIIGSLMPFSPWYFYSILSLLHLNGIQTWLCPPLHILGIFTIFPLLASEQLWWSRWEGVVPFLRVSNGSWEWFKTSFAVKSSMHLVCFSDLKDTHSLFWWVTFNVYRNSTGHLKQSLAKLISWEKFSCTLNECVAVSMAGTDPRSVHCMRASQPAQA